MGIMTIQLRKDGNYERFRLQRARKGLFWPESVGQFGAELKNFGQRVLLVYGGGSIKKTGLYDKVVAEIEQAGLELFELSGLSQTSCELCESGCRYLQAGTY